MLGGGVNLLVRGTFPAPMAVDLLVMLELDNNEAVAPHKLQIIVRTDDGTTLARAEGFLQASGQVRYPEMALPLLSPAILPLGDVALPGPGRYAIEVEVPGEASSTVEFGVVLPEKEVAAPPT